MITEQIDEEQEETQEIEDGTNEYIDDSDRDDTTEEEESATNDNVRRGRSETRTLRRTDSDCNWTWTDAVSSQPVRPASSVSGAS